MHKRKMNKRKRFLIAFLFHFIVDAIETVIKNPNGFKGG